MIPTQRFGIWCKNMKHRELPSEIYKFYLRKLSINPKKRGSCKVGMLFFSQKIMNMFPLVHVFGMQMVEFCGKNYIEL